MQTPSDETRRPSRRGFAAMDPDRRREIARDGDPFDGPADLRAERANRLPVVRVQARQPVESFVDGRRFRHDPPEGVRRYAEASRHANAFDPRKLPEVRALAANDCDLRLVDVLETHLVAAHPPPSAPSAFLIPTVFAPTPVGRLVACSVNTPGALATRPPPSYTIGNGLQAVSC